MIYPVVVLLISTQQLIALGQTTSGQLESPEVLRLVEKFNHRLRDYHGLEFEYAVSFRAAGDRHGEQVENKGSSINRVRFANPIDEGSLQYRVLWEKTVENPGEPLFDGDRIRSLWIGFDGRETRRFRQTFLTEPKAKTQSSGLIRPGQSLSLIRISEDCFLSFISNDIYHSMTYMRNFDPSDLLGRFQVSVGGSQKYLGEDCLVAKFDPLPELGNAVSSTSLLATENTRMVLRSEGGTYGKPSDWGSLEEVTRIDEHEGIKFPAQGRYVESLSSSMLEGEFDVLGVRRLSEDEIENWFPEWPPGTSVMDEGTGRMTRIPYTPEQQDIIRKFMMKRTALSAIGWGNVTMMLFNLTAISVIGYFVYRKVRAAFS